MEKSRSESNALVHFDFFKTDIHFIGELERCENKIPVFD